MHTCKKSYSSPLFLSVFATIFGDEEPTALVIDRFMYDNPTAMKQNILTTSRRRSRWESPCVLITKGYKGNIYVTRFQALLHWWEWETEETKYY